MRITKLKINYFGRFHNKEIELKPGINLIYGENEAGKSTLHTFIKGMLFGIERMRGRGAASKEDLYTRYLPWHYPGAYGGSMDIEVKGKQYRLQRSFHAIDKSFSVLDLATGREVMLEEGKISELIPGLWEATYRNTISMEQRKAQTDSELALQVRNYITNLSLARSQEINVAQAVNVLTEQRKQLEAIRNSPALKALQLELEEGEAKERKLDQLTVQLRELLEQEKELLRQREELHIISDDETARRMEQLPAILEKYHTYEELQNQMLQLENQLTQLKKRESDGDRQQLVLNKLKEDKRISEGYRKDLYNIDIEERELVNRLEQLHKKRNKILYFSIPLAVTAALLMTFLWDFSLLGFILGGLAFLFGGAYGLIQNGRYRKTIHKLKAKRDDLLKQSTDIQNEIMDVLTRYQVDNVEALADRVEEHLRSMLTDEHTMELQRELESRKNKIMDQMDSIYDTIMTYLQHFVRVEELTPEIMQQITEELRLRKQEETARQVKLNEVCEACRMKIEKLRWEITALEGNEEELQKNRSKYDHMKQQEAENATELEAIRLALSTIEELSSQIHDSFGQQLNQTVAQVISEVTGQRYQELKIDEKLDIKLAWNGTYVALERLSTGTMDQVFLALRLAVADLLLGKDEVPLIFDDSFAMYDDTRLKAALTEVANRKQILLFTCHKREQRLLEELQIPYHLVQLS